MLLALIAFLGGALTIISPCILPVLPFVFAHPGKSFARSTLPMLAGMAVTFAGIATLAAVGGAWAVRLNSYGRIAALVLLAAFGIALISTRVANWIARPFVSLGSRLAESSSGTERIAPAILLGVATGLLWAPCAGPILGLILTGAAINGPNTQTTLLLFAYALGAIASLALATIAGARIFRAFRQSLGAAEWVRRGLGVAVLAGVIAIALGWDTGVLTQLSFASTNRVEQSLIDAIRGRETQDEAHGDAMSGAMMAMSGKSAGAPRVEGELPSLSGAVAWLNSNPLTTESLRGKVVMVDFWTYSCINCLRTLPYLRAWQERYKDYGFTIVGVHTPEFAFEKQESNVSRAVRELGIRYPVAIDNDYTIWRAFNNEYWPAHYFVDSQGRIRGHHFGEGGYDESEQLIRELLTEAGHRELPAPTDVLNGRGIEAAPDESSVASPETYVGYDRAANFVSAAAIAPDRPGEYQTPSELRLNQWALSGNWTVGAESATSNAAGGKISFRFHARDLHLVLGPREDGKPVRFRVTIDGRAPAQDRGVDVDTKGVGVVHEQRLYQLIRQSESVQDRTFTIEFLDPGVQAYAFTFG
ncbi:MAG TPA: cytochrome c biogenesis protein DipZ [Steroidobacteraceae bacterium]|nr:cytochrome c biogenesis protein DipZ [Steroidobacteraceae bacterium]